MKTTRISLAIFLLLPVFLLGQSNPLDNYFQKYAGQEGVYFLDLNTNMAAAFASEEEPSVAHRVNLKILTLKAEENPGLDPDAIRSDFYTSINRALYTGLIDVKSADEDVEIMVKKEDQSVSEVLFVVREKSEVSFIAASGNFDLKKLANLKNLKECQSLKLLGQMCDE